MSTLGNLIEEHTDYSKEDAEYLALLVGDWQLLADLSFADIVLWLPTRDGRFVAVSHARPSSAPTLFYRDFLGQAVRDEWRDYVVAAFESGEVVETTAPDWFEEIPTRMRAVPVRKRETRDGSTHLRTLGIVTRHANLLEGRRPGRQEIAFSECADELFDMISTGDFPDVNAPPVPRRGAPRASDGLLRLDADGITTFASPNGLSAFNRLGFKGELEGESLAEVTAEIVAGKRHINESLPLVVTGRAPWQTDIETNGVTISLRSIPLRMRGERRGAIVLTRDVTSIRHQERELLTKDATIREIHHRVKNNLQTVASLLRIQARRSRSEDAKESLTQAMRRVAAIAVVHDTLSGGLDQSVDFDLVFDRVLLLVTEVAASHSTTVSPKKVGSFGVLPSDYATPLALALTELVTNAVEHGLKDASGEVTIEAERTPDLLRVRVRDNGVGLPEGRVGAGLGTQIIKTLIQGELGGTIDWHTPIGNGTEVTVEIPFRWLPPSATE